MLAAMVDLYCQSYKEAPVAVIPDIDDTVDVVHGAQQLSFWNGFHRERCFLPIHIYDTSGRRVAMILRTGKTPRGPEIAKLLARLLRRIPRHWPDTHITLRGDGHYGRPEVMDWCDDKRLDYIFGLAGNGMPHRDPGIVTVPDALCVKRAEHKAPVLRCYAETRYGAKSWKRERRVALAWRVRQTQVPIGFDEQREALTAVLAILPAGTKPVLMGDRIYGSPDLIACGDHMLSDVELTTKRVRTNVAMVHEPGHPEPWIIALSEALTLHWALDYGLRWEIEAMFSDFKTRGFGIEDSHIRIPKMLDHLILIMAIALYWAVSTGMWDAVNNPTTLEKKRRQTTAQLRQSHHILLQTRHPTNPAMPPEALGTPSALECLGKLTHGEKQYRPLLIHLAIRDKAKLRRINLNGRPFAKPCAPG